jgi:hypothetical protein
MIGAISAQHSIFLQVAVSDADALFQQPLASQLSRL